jgi:hypothetical protein
MMTAHAALHIPPAGLSLQFSADAEMDQFMSAADH